MHTTQVGEGPFLESLLIIEVIKERYLLHFVSPCKAIYIIIHNSKFLLSKVGKPRCLLNIPQKANQFVKSLTSINMKKLKQVFNLPTSIHLED